MKRSMLIGMALLAVSGALYAQDWPSEDTVLDKARANYQGDSPKAVEETKTVTNADGSVTTIVTVTTTTQTSTQAGQVVPSVSAISANREDGEDDYTPFVIAFVPGIQFPFGVSYRTSVAGGYIGVSAIDVNGIMGSGVFGIVEEDMNGAMGSGVFNINGGDVSGFQGAGVFNIVEGDAIGFQGAGVFNIVEGETSGPFQGAGVFNINEGTLNGFQGAGVFNISGKVNGVQAAGVLNIADKVNGIQIGLVNIADDVEGLQIGLVSICANGIGNVQSYWETGDMVYSALQFGTRNFYTLITVQEKQDDWFDNFDTFGTSLGFGWRAIRLGHDGPYLDIDASAKVSQGSNVTELVSALKEQRMIDETKIVDTFSSPYLRASVGLPLFFGLEIFGGMSCDLEIPGYTSLSDNYKVGDMATFSFWDVDVLAYSKWFFGAKLEL